MDEKLLALPWQIQVALGSGYAAYTIAYSGIRDHHKPVDTAFRSAAFGLVASAVLFLFAGRGPVLAGAGAFAAAVAAGVLWRVVGVSGLRSLLRWSNVSWSDDTPSAWATLNGSSAYNVTQISVLLEDGTWLFCDRAADFIDAPHGPCVFGNTGDMLLYVTSTEDKDGNAADVERVSDPAWGSQLTYIPAAKIKRALMRYKPRPTLWELARSVFLRWRG